MTGRIRRRQVVHGLINEYSESGLTSSEIRAQSAFASPGTAQGKTVGVGAAAKACVSGHNRDPL